MTDFTMTRDQVAMRRLTSAGAAMKALAAHCEAVFAEYVAAQEQGREEGYVFDVELCAGLAAYFSEWKQRQAARAARELVREDLTSTSPLKLA